MNPGKVMLSRDGRTAYRVEGDGRWVKLPAVVAVKLIEEKQAKDYIQSERERVIREKNEREAAKLVLDVESTAFTPAQLLAAANGSRGTEP